MFMSLFFSVAACCRDSSDSWSHFPLMMSQGNAQNMPPWCVHRPPTLRGGTSFDISSAQSVCQLVEKLLPTDYLLHILVHLGGGILGTSTFFQPEIRAVMVDGPPKWMRSTLNDRVSGTVFSSPVWSHDVSCTSPAMKWWSVSLL